MKFIHKYDIMPTSKTHKLVFLRIPKCVLFNFPDDKRIKERSDNDLERIIYDHANAKGH